MSIEKDRTDKKGREEKEGKRGIAAVMDQTGYPENAYTRGRQGLFGWIQMVHRYYALRPVK